jgi:hypothetical protein
MKIENTTIKKVIFDNYGSRRFFSADVNTSYYSQSFPAFAFPTSDEENLKNQFAEIFQVDIFNEENHFPAYVIEDGQLIWGFSNHNGEIFSPNSIYLNDEQLSRKIISNYSSLEKDFPGITNCISRTDKINAVVAFYLLENIESEMVDICQRYYRNLLLKDDLLKNLGDTNIQKTRTKI